MGPESYRQASVHVIGTLFLLGDIAKLFGMEFEFECKDDKLLLPYLWHYIVIFWIIYEKRDPYLDAKDQHTVFINWLNLHMQLILY